MKKNIPMQHRVKDLLMIVLAVLLNSLGVSLFYGPLCWTVWHCCPLEKV